MRESFSYSIISPNLFTITKSQFENLILGAEFEILSLITEPSIQTQYPLKRHEYTKCFIVSLDPV